MTAMIIVSFLLVALYVGAAIWNNRGLPESISSMVYIFPTGWQWVWIVWMWCVGLLCCIPAIEILSVKCLEFFGFVTMCSIMFCGAMPIVMNRSNTAHNIFGISAGVFSQICVLWINPAWLLSWLCLLILPVISIFCKRRSFIVLIYDYGIFILEVLCWISFAGCLLSEKL